MDTSFKKYMLNQIHKIEIDKWCEGEKIEGDPGVDFIKKWIRENGSKFHELWDKSLCKDCIHCEECGFKLKEKCKKQEREIS